MHDLFIKNNRNIITFLLILIQLFSLIACTNYVSNDDNTKNFILFQIIAEEQRKAQEAEANKARISFSAKSIYENTRAAVPQDVGVNDLTYSLEYYTSSMTEHLTQSFSTYTEFSAVTLELEKGRWTFELSAQKDGTTIFTSSVTKDIVPGENSISFELQELDSGTGSLSVTISAPSDAGITKITASLKSLQGSVIENETELTATSGTNNYTFEKSELEKGTYILSYKLYCQDSTDSSKITTTNYVELVRVIPGVHSTTSAPIELTKEYINSLCTITFSNMADSSGNSWWLPTYDLTLTYPKYTKITLPVAENTYRKSYYMLGWHKEADLSDTLLTELVIEEDITLYADWKTVTMKSGPEINALLTPSPYYIGWYDSKKFVPYTESITDSELEALEKITLSTDDSPIPCYAWIDTSTSPQTIYYYAKGFTNNSNSCPIYLSEDFSSTFSEGDCLKEIDLSGFDSENVTNMSSLFSGCTYLTSITFGNDFSTANVTDMSSMFKNTKNLPSVDLSGFNTEKVTTMESMFQQESNAYLTELDLSSFNCKNVTSMNSMFFGQVRLTTLKLSDTFCGSSTDETKLTDIRSMFYNCYLLTTIENLSAIKTENITSLEKLFYNCKTLTSLDLTSFDTSNITDLSSAFYNCMSLTSIDLSSFNTEKITTMANTFYGCEELTSIDLSNFSSDSLTNLSNCFYECTQLENITFGDNFTISSVTNLSYMFYKCSALESLDLSNFDCSSLTNTTQTFAECTNLKTIIVDKTVDWSSLTSITGSSRMFYNCTNLVGGAGTTLDSSNVHILYARIDYGPSSENKGYFTAGNSYATLTYDANGGSLSESIQILKKGESSSIYSIDTSGISYEDHIFLNWNTTSDGSGSSYLAEAEISITENTTLYANYGLPVLYIEEGATASTSSITAGFTEAESLPTLTQALAQINNVVNTNKCSSSMNWTFYLSGTITDSAEISSDLSATSLTISKNSSASTATISGNATESILIISASKAVSLNDIVLSGNITDGINGAAIRKTGTSELTLSNCEISDNQSLESSSEGGLGGGIYLASGSLYLDSTNFYGNQANQNGGAIYAASGTNLYIYGTSQLGKSGDAYTVNIATSGNGGAIYLASNSKLFLYGNTTIGESQTTAASSTSYANKAALGGGIYNDGGYIYMGYSDASTQQELTGGIYYNYASDSSSGGGGIYLASGYIYIETGNINYNACAAHGGGLYQADGTVVITAVSINSNTAAGNGGGIYQSGGKITMNGGSVNSNTASGNGGGLYTLSKFNMTGGTIYLNKATNGGGAGIGSGGTLSLTGDSVIGLKTTTTGTPTPTSYGNYATGKGGGVYAEGTLNLGYNHSSLTTDTDYDGGLFYNYAQGDGGGLYSNDASCYLVRGNISYNASTSNGGGIYIEGTPFTVTNMKINHNLATKYGGGLYTNSGTTTLSIASSEINYNTASKQGGGIYNDNSKITLPSGTVSHNSANASSGNGGGGVYNNAEDSSIEISGGSVSNNNSPNANGAGIYNEGRVTISAGSIAGNTSTGDGNGGGIYNQSGAYLYLNGTGVIGDKNTYSVANSTDHSNSADYGGAIYNNNGYVYIGYITSNDPDSDFTGGIYYNYSERGGAIYNTSNNTYIANGTIKYNAATLGGAIFNASQYTITMSGGSISNNESTYASYLYSGAYYSNGNNSKFIISASAQIPPDIERYNSIYLYSGTTLSLNSALTADSPIASITPAEYPFDVGVDGVQVLSNYTSTDYVTDNANKFLVTPRSDANYLYKINPSTGCVYRSDFVKIEANTITGLIASSGVFLDGRSIDIDAFYICDHEVTQKEYETYCTYGASTPGTEAISGSTTYQTEDGDSQPAMYVSWYDALVYCNLRSIAEGLDPVYTIDGSTDPSSWSGILTSDSKYYGPSSSNDSWNAVTQDMSKDGYRLPTEAEWEYAARGGQNGINGTQTLYAGSDTYDDYAWFSGNSDNTTHEVKGKDPNGANIYDMSGNLCELCWDWYEETLTTSTPATGPESSSVTQRSCRGGAYQYDMDLNKRVGNAPTARYNNAGFRVVRTALY